jgi:hypothetical protein
VIHPFNRDTIITGEFSLIPWCDLHIKEVGRSTSLPNTHTSSGVLHPIIYDWNIIMIVYAAFDHCSNSCVSVVLIDGGLR